MIKKLRRKFIFISMLSVFVVLFSTVGIINLANYISINNKVNDSLVEVINQGTKDEPQGGEPGQQKIDLRGEHYFVAVIDNGEIIDKNYSHMFIYSEAECNEYILKAYNASSNEGKYESLKYKKEVKSDGYTYVGFVDIREKLNDFKRYLLLSMLISLGAYLVLFALIYIGSKVVFKHSEETYKNQKRFITNASHELKTPLTIISADIDLIEMDNGKTEWSESIRDQVVKLNDMTNQLVTLAKLEEEDKSRFPLEDFSLNELFNKATEEYKKTFKKEGIKFSYNMMSNINMYGNKKLIDELIYIFLDNSVKYTSGETKSSYFVISEEKNKIIFRFSNTLAKDDEIDVRQIMDRFYRSPTNKKNGSGIGLSIAQEIINYHKGKIKVDKNNSTLSFVITFSK